MRTAYFSCLYDYGVSSSLAYSRYISYNFGIVAWLTNWFKCHYICGDIEKGLKSLEKVYEKSYGLNIRTQLNQMESPLFKLYICIYIFFYFQRNLSVGVDI